MPKPKTEAPVVKPGQVWADNDPRSAGRTVEVKSTHHGRYEHVAMDATRPHGYARCVVLSDRTDLPTYRYGNGRGPKSQVGKETWIRFDRMRPTSTGYRLVQDAPATEE